MRTRRMRPGVVAALAGVLLSGFSLGLAGTSQPASAGSDHERWSDSSGCTDIVVLGARGSGQDDEDSDKTHLGLGPEVHGFYDGLVEALKPKGLTTSYLPLDYPAVPKTSWLYGNPLTGTPNIWDSVEIGRKNAPARVESIHQKCPDARIVLAGYSQGAWALKEGAAHIRSADRNSIAALVLLADPVFDPGGGGRILGNPEPGRGGIAGRYTPPGISRVPPTTSVSGEIWFAKVTTTTALCRRPR